MPDRTELLRAIIDATGKSIEWEPGNFWRYYEAPVGPNMSVNIDTSRWFSFRVGIYHRDDQKCPWRYHDIYQGKGTIVKELLVAVKESLKRRREKMDEAELKRQEQVETELLRLLKGKSNG